MKQYKHTVVLVLLAALLLALPVSAQEITVDPATKFCFSADDFTTADKEDGIFLTSVPRSSVATIRYGNRILKAGDALPLEALNQLTLETGCVTQQNASIGYVCVSGGVATGAKELKLSILPRKNQPPTTQDGQLETYRNIPNSGTFSVSDPENGTLTYTIVQEPKRGTVVVHEDGTYTYTPNENKVGKDCFTFTVTDEAGNTSEPAKITVLIKKPADKTTYADMDGDPDAFSAMWLKDQGLFTGSSIGGNLCFEPDAPISRGEFLIMAMKLVNAQASDSQMTSGFADEAGTPAWMRPYVVSALRNGMISGVQSDDGIVFLPAASLTKAEAAVMLQNILQLPGASSQTVFAAEEAGTVPAWAGDAAAALSAAGIQLDASDADPLTRRDAARLFYQVSQLLEETAISTFYWVQ